MTLGEGFWTSKVVKALSGLSGPSWLSPHAVHVAEPMCLRIKCSYQTWLKLNAGLIIALCSSSIVYIMIRSFCHYPFLYSSMEVYKSKLIKRGRKCWKFQMIVRDYNHGGILHEIKIIFQRPITETTQKSSITLIY